MSHFELSALRRVHNLRGLDMEAKIRKTAATVFLNCRYSFIISSGHVFVTGKRSILHH